MTIVSVQNKDRGLLFDANGCEIKYATSANLETGECELIVMGRNGLPKLNWLRRVRRCHRKFPAPLRFERFA